MTREGALLLSLTLSHHSQTCTTPISILTPPPLSPPPKKTDVDVNEWVAVNCSFFLSQLLKLFLTPLLYTSLNHKKVVDLFNNLNLFYSVVTEFCTVENNPTMSAGPGFVLFLSLFFLPSFLVNLSPGARRMDYTWIDASRKRVKLPAPQYIDYVLTWVEGLIKDESVFPTKAGKFSLFSFPLGKAVSPTLKLTKHHRSRTRILPKLPLRRPTHLHSTPSNLRPSLPCSLPYLSSSFL